MSYVILVSVGFRIFFLLGLLALLWCWPLIILLFPVFLVQRIRFKNKIKRDLMAGRAHREFLFDIVCRTGNPAALHLADRQLPVHDDDVGLLRDILGNSPRQFDGGTVDLAPESGLVTGLRDRDAEVVL